MDAVRREVAVQEARRINLTLGRLNASITASRRSVWGRTGRVETAPVESLGRHTSDSLHLRCTAGSRSTQNLWRKPTVAAAWVPDDDGVSP
ncbi:MAG: hypothetical protein QOD67_1318 [Caballeronia sp.]|jgi:hypothetical protein|nr:hypothetical protein [Caballeronia sp.]